ncbi:hypothetical protein Cenrod_0256 [Candidatus Symbiobacter mobilis CR]|uniref:Uncharacterized protein n=1 Tax=Candidatus Symbiobacter mobilis CR TaxID=946483 RepID=U5N7Z9_9BURK|nr:hypothetical protein Cenrod_0256 [Candidatus Symbiobacter mobilis CR]
MGGLVGDLAPGFNQALAGWVRFCGRKAIAKELLPFCPGQVTVDELASMVWSTSQSGLLGWLHSFQLLDSGLKDVAQRLHVGLFGSWVFGGTS